MDKPREYTKEEVREMFLNHIRSMVSCWSKIDGKTTEEKLDGLAFSILNIFDGTTVLPSFDIVVKPHPDDKDYCIKGGINYFEDGMVINDILLHEIYFNNCKRRLDCLTQKKQPVKI